MDIMGLQELPDEIRVEVLSTIDMEYAVWKSIREDAMAQE